MARTADACCVNNEHSHSAGCGVGQNKTWNAILLQDVRHCHCRSDGSDWHMGLGCDWPGTVVGGGRVDR
eukprot:896297-Rhodomonas_salina.1